MLLVLEESDNPKGSREARVPWIGRAQTRAGWDTAHRGWQRSRLKAGEHEPLTLRVTAVVSWVTFASTQECPQRNPLSPYAPCKPSQPAQGAAATED